MTPKSITRLIHLHLDTYHIQDEDYSRMAVCGYIVHKLLGALPPTLRVTISTEDFPGASSLWIRDGKNPGEHTPSSWTWGKDDDQLSLCFETGGGFFSGAIRQLEILFGERFSEITPDNPAQLFFKFEAVD